MFFSTITLILLLALGVVDARAAPHPVKNLTRRAFKLTFGGKEREVGYLPNAYQPDIGHGVACAISAGYEDPKAGGSLVPATVIVFEKETKPGSELEIQTVQDRRLGQMRSFADKAGQFLDYDDKGPNYLFLVLRNPQKDFPTSGSSELKMFHEHYMADTSMNVTEKLTKARELGHVELMRLAKEKKIFRTKYGIKTAMMDSNFTRIVFFDWEPSSDSKKRPGVIEVSDRTHSNTVKKYDALLKKDINKGFTLSDLKELLKKEFQSLREGDEAAWKVEDEAKKKATEEAKNNPQIPVTRRSKRIL